MVHFSSRRFIFAGILLSSCLLNPSSAANYKSFQSNQRYILTLNGQFESGESLRFQKFLSTHPKTQFILLQSYGGSVNEAMKVGQLIRRANLNTAVETYCYSACFITLMSGTERYVQEGAYVGVHRPFFDKKEALVQDEQNSTTYKNLTHYFKFMLGSQRQSQRVVKLMYETPSKEMQQVNQSEHYLKLHYYPHTSLY